MQISYTIRMCCADEDILDKIDRWPTAFDIGKVIEEIQQKRLRHLSLASITRYEDIRSFHYGSHSAYFESIKILEDAEAGFGLSDRKVKGGGIENG